MINGIGLGHLPDIVMSNVLSGTFAGSNYVRESILWPEQARPVTGTNSLPLGDSVSIGADNLDAAIKTAVAQLRPGEKVTVVGLSAGALVADEEMRRLASDPNAPDKSQLTFIVIGDSSRIPFNTNRYEPFLGYTFTPPPQTGYNTIAVKAEYDGLADFPDRAWNIVAVANALAGAILQHVPSMGANLSTVPASNITVTTNSLGGVTTSYLIPAPDLPLVRLMPTLKPIEPILRSIVDSAYERNDNKGMAAASSTVAARAVDPNTDADEPSAIAAVSEHEEKQQDSAAIAVPDNEPAAPALQSDSIEQAPPADESATAEIPSPASDGATPSVRGRASHLSPGDSGADSRAAHNTDGPARTSKRPAR